MAKVSIVTPAYNAQDSIRDVYESIRNQTFTDWEWIVVDDCSKDKTFEILGDIASKDHRVRIFQNEKNSRAAVSRNLATKMATGKYIAFLDADDMWKKDKLAHQIAFMEKNDYVYTYTNYDVHFYEGKTIPFRPKRNYSNYKIMLRQCDVGCLTVIYNAEKIGKIYMPENCPNREDYAAWLTIMKAGVVAHRLDENLAVYSVGKETAVTTDKVKIFKSHYYVYRHYMKFNFFKSAYYICAFTFHKIFKGY